MQNLPLAQKTLNARNTSRRVALQIHVFVYRQTLVLLLSNLETSNPKDYKETLASTHQASVCSGWSEGGRRMALRIDYLIDKHSILLIMSVPIIPSLSSTHREQVPKGGDNRYRHDQQYLPRVKPAVEHARLQ